MVKEEKMIRGFCDGDKGLNFTNIKKIKNSAKLPHPYI